MNPPLNFIYGHYHLWLGTSHIILSDESSKKLSYFKTLDDVVNHLYLSHAYDAARALNTEVQGLARLTWHYMGQPFHFVPEGREHYSKPLLPGSIVVVPAGKLGSLPLYGTKEQILFWLRSLDALDQLLKLSSTLSSTPSKE